MCFPVVSAVTNLAAMQETQEMQIQSLGWEDPLEEEMAMHSSFLVWIVLWTEEPGGLQSKGLLRLGHNWARENHEKFPLCSRLKEQKIKISIDLRLISTSIIKRFKHSKCQVTDDFIWGSLFCPMELFSNSSIIVKTKLNFGIVLWRKKKSAKVGIPSNRSRVINVYLKNKQPFLQLSKHPKTGELVTFW